MSVIYDVTGIFADLSNLPGGKNECRRVLLGRSKSFAGPFSKVLGNSVIELISATGNKGKRIYENRFWGDPGFIHLCYDMRGMDELKEFCEKKDFPLPLTVRRAMMATALIWVKQPATSLILRILTVP